MTSVKDEKSNAHKPTYLQFCFFYQALMSSLLWKQYLPALCVALVISGLLQNLNDHLCWMVLRLSIPYLSFLKMMMIPSLRTQNQRMNQRLRICHSEQHCLEILKASWRVLKCGSSQLTTVTADTLFGCVILRKFCQVSNLLIFTIFLESVKVYAKRRKHMVALWQHLDLSNTCDCAIWAATCTVWRGITRYCHFLLANSSYLYIIFQALGNFYLIPQPLLNQLGMFNGLFLFFAALPPTITSTYISKFLGQK